MILECRAITTSGITDLYRISSGNLFISLNTASEYGHINEEFRGKLDTTLVPGKPMQKHAAVSYRGWIMKIKKGWINGAVCLRFSIAQWTGS